MRSGGYGACKPVNVFINFQEDISMGISGIFKKKTGKNSVSSSNSIEGLAKIPAGSFIMGSDKFEREGPAHKVVLDSFFIDRTMVTQADYESLMGVNPVETGRSELHPVSNVSWYDGVLYCNARSRRDGYDPVYRYTVVKGAAGNGCYDLENLKIDLNRNGYHLPTEAQWEYACRAGTTTIYYWGDEMNGDYAWWFENANDVTHPVGTKKPNAWGLYDMIGNLWEWCNDWNGREYYEKSPLKNPRGPKSGEYRSLRGGGCRNRAEELRLTLRGRLDPDDHGFSYGFRCARN
jgi:formylglycine-generating enzyme required for sulfatase activity